MRAFDILMFFGFVWARKGQLKREHPERWVSLQRGCMLVLSPNIFILYLPRLAYTNRVKQTPMCLILIADRRQCANATRMTASGISRWMPSKRSGNAEMSDLKMAIGNVIKYSTLTQETYKACKSQMLVLYFLHAPLRHTDPFPLCPAQAHCRPFVLTKG